MQQRTIHKTIDEGGCEKVFDLVTRRYRAHSEILAVNTVPNFAIGFVTLFDLSHKE